MFRWFRDWQRYIGKPLGAYPFNEDATQSQPFLFPNTASRPGPIDNSDIIIREIDGESDDPELIITLEEGRDYVLVAQEVWEKLSEW